MIIPALKKTYKDQVALNLPEWELETSSVVAVCGQNGSGKSTLGKLLAGIIKDDSGKIVNLGISVGYMTQQAFAFNISVLSNLRLNAPKNLTNAEITKKGTELLRALGIENLANKNAKKLSGGETEKVALARLLMKEYDLLILDEPTTAMDADSVTAAENLIMDYHKRTGCTIILITHSAQQAMRMADKIFDLN